MYPKIEYEFKKRSWYKRDTRFVIILYCIYIALAITVSSLLNSVWYSYLMAPLLFVIQYIYFFVVLKRRSDSQKVLFWKIRHNVNEYIDARKQNELKLLVDVCIESDINTRPKVLEALRHYQVLVPRNIIGSGVFLSLVAIIISVFAFSYDESNIISSTRLQLMFSIFFLVAILYGFFKFTSDQILSVFGTKAFYKRMEDLISTIYFQSLIK